MESGAEKLNEEDVEVLNMDEYTARIADALTRDQEFERIERVEQIKTWLILGFSDNRIVATALRKTHWGVSAEQIASDITVARFEMEQQANMV